MSANHLSTYTENLSEEAKTCYKEKLKIIDEFDPITGTTGELANHLPPIEAVDIVSYLVLQTSFITAKQFKARKKSGSIQSICEWLGKGSLQLKSHWKICCHWTSKFNLLLAGSL